MKSIKILVSLGLPKMTDLALHRTYYYSNLRLYPPLRFIQLFIIEQQVFITIANFKNNVTFTGIVKTKKKKIPLKHKLHDIQFPYIRLL